MTMFSMAGTTPDRTLSVIYATGDTATIPETHERFEELLALLFSGADDDIVSDLIDRMLAVSKRMAQLSERVSIRGRAVFFDGDQLRGDVASVLVEIFEAGNPESLRPVVNFLEKASTNPSRQSIDDMYRWIANGDMLLHEDGDMLAYKGTRTGDDGVRTSWNRGTAFVDGEEVTGYIPNPDGAVITMPRSAVDDNSNEACSTGLHVGTARYAFDFAVDETVLVKFNPRDIVAVPADSSGEKMRICRYEVVGKVESRQDARVQRDSIPEPVPAPEEAPEPLFEVVAVGYVDFSEEGVEDYEDELEDGEELVFPVDAPAPSQSEEDRLASEEALAALRAKLQSWQAPKTEAEVEAEAQAEQVIRDAKGRFTSESAVKAVRDSKGRFTKQS